MDKEYIEREALLNELGEELKINTPMYNKEQNEFVNRGIKIAIRDIRKQPTADVQEVRHGKNITKKYPTDEFICSECGHMNEDCTETKYNDDGDYYYICEYEYKFCPECGAKMDKED